MNKVFDFFGGRKYFLALVFLSLVSVAFFLGYMDAPDWTSSLEWLLMIYLGANAAKAIPDALARKNGKE